MASDENDIRASFMPIPPQPLPGAGPSAPNVHRAPDPPLPREAVKGYTNNLSGTAPTGEVRLLTTAKGYPNCDLVVDTRRLADCEGAILRLYAVCQGIRVLAAQASVTTLAPTRITAQGFGVTNWDSTIDWHLCEGVDGATQLPVSLITYGLNGNGSSGSGGISGVSFFNNGTPLSENPNYTKLNVTGNATITDDGSGQATLNVTSTPSPLVSEYVLTGSLPGFAPSESDAMTDGGATDGIELEDDEAYSFTYDCVIGANSQSYRFTGSFDAAQPAGSLAVYNVTQETDAPDGLSLSFEAGGSPTRIVVLLQTTALELKTNATIELRAVKTAIPSP